MHTRPAPIPARPTPPRPLPPPRYVYYNSKAASQTPISGQWAELFLVGSTLGAQAGPGANLTLFNGGMNHLTGETTGRGKYRGGICEAGPLPSPSCATCSGWLPSTPSPPLTRRSPSPPPQGTLIFVCYLVWLASFNAGRARATQESTISAGDYTIEVAGLSKLPPVIRPTSDMKARFQAFSSHARTAGSGPHLSGIRLGRAAFCLPPRLVDPSPPLPLPPSVPAPPRPPALHSPPCPSSLPSCPTSLPFSSFPGGRVLR